MGDIKNVFGFELIQEIYNSQITKKEDVLILFVHWYFIKYGFRCIGIGDSKAFEPTEKGSQLLPEGWNTHPNYTLRYIKDSKLFIFHGIRSDEDLLINLLKVDDQNVSTVQFPINQTINELHGPLESVIPSYQNVINVIQEDLIHALIPSNMIGNSTQTNSTRNRSRDNPLRVGESILSSSASYPWNRGGDPLRVGVADLNPFAQGGGMIFDPFSPQRNRMNPSRPGLGVPGRLPPGAVPPFAKFDPFGPPDVNQPRPRRDPDDDHLPPPGYDDMFM